MKLLGTVTFTEHGKTYAWSSREAPPSTREHALEIVEDGILIPTEYGRELVAWDAIEDVRGRVIGDPLDLETERRLHEPTLSDANPHDSAALDGDADANGHQTLSHRAQVRESRSNGERRADEESRS